MMIPYLKALEIFGDLTADWAHEKVPIEDAFHRVLAQNVIASADHPAFDNSAMDGYALRWEDFAGNTSDPFTVSHIIHAGSSTTVSEPCSPRQAVKIMTGAPVPDWCDTVIPVEKTREEGSSIWIDTLPAKGSHVRYRGEDMAAGQTILRSPRWVDAETHLLLANLGCGHVSCRIKPRVGVFSTGDELIPPGFPLKPGGIYNSTAFFLKSALNSLGLRADSKILRDNPDQAFASIGEFLKGGADPTLLITTGAVSMGDKDFIPSLARDLGFEVRIHKVAVRPGKPFFLAQRHNQIWVGIPGNPVSTMTSWHFMLRPLLASWYGSPSHAVGTVELDNDLSKPQNLRCFYRAKLNGQRAFVYYNQGSARLAASISANAYAILPEGQSTLCKGSRVSVVSI